MKMLWLCAVLTTTLIAHGASADELSYSSVDRATVRVLALAAPDVVMIEHRGTRYGIGIPVGGHGSGTLVTENGLVLTAAHVVKNARVLAVHLPGVREAVPARVVYTNDEEDYAFIRVPGNFQQVAHIAPPDAPLKVRETIFAIGYPLDATRVDPQSSRGAISGKLPDGRLQLDISINPGNSGGPVINEKELVQAMIVARSDVQRGAVGLASAVPVATFRKKLDELSAANPDVSDLTSEAAKNLANMVSALAQDGPEWFKGSLEVSKSQTEINQKVKHMAQQEQNSADAQILASVYFWNRYLVHIASGEEGEALRIQALACAERAVKLAPELKKSEFVEYVLRDAREPHESSRRGARPRHHEGFFLKGGYGLGYVSLHAAPDYRSASMSGLARQWEILLGGGKRGVAYGVALTMATGSLHYTQTNSKPSEGEPKEISGDAEFSSTRFGTFVQIYPWITGGFHVQGQLYLSSLSASASSISFSENGVGVTLGVGYDFWFANHWSIGITGSVGYMGKPSDSRVDGSFLPTASAGITWY